MFGKYHISKRGVPAKCNVTKDNCPLGTATDRSYDGLTLGTGDMIVVKYY